MSHPILHRLSPAADVRLRYGPGAMHFGDVRLPPGPGPHPVVIVVHGGFWRAAYDLTHIGHLCAALTAAGAATWNVEYRRLGQSGGGWPGTFQDVAAAADHVRELAVPYDLDLDRVAALGHSAGGHLALWLAGRGRIPADDEFHTVEPLRLKAAVSLAGVVDLEMAYALDLGQGVVGDLMGGSPDRVPERYHTASPAAMLPLGVRQVLVHGANDNTVPLAMSEAYSAAALAAGDDVSLRALPSAGHFELIDPTSKEWPSVLAAVMSVSVVA